MGRGVVPSYLPSAAGVDCRGRGLADSELARDHRAQVGDHTVGGLLRVFHPQAAALRRDGAGVADLAARLPIKRSVLEKQLDVLAFDSHIDRLSILAHGYDGRRSGELVVTGEL